MRRSVLAGTTFIFAAAVVAASDVAASPSGYVYLAVGGGTLGSGCTDATPCPPHVRVFDAATGEVVVTIPLPSGAVPEGMALSHDGSHLYVSGRSATAGGAASMTVIDARHHTAIASYALGANDFGELAVRGNDSRVYIMGRSSPPTGTPVPQIQAFDTSTHAVAVRSDLAQGTGRLAYSRTTDTVFALLDLVNGSTLTAFDPETLSPVRSTAFTRDSGALGSSLDGDTLYANLFAPAASAETDAVALIDPVSLGVRSEVPAEHDLIDVKAVEGRNPSEAAFVKTVSFANVVLPSGPAIHAFNVTTRAVRQVAPMGGTSVQALTVPAGGRFGYALATLRQGQPFFSGFDLDGRPRSGAAQPPSIGPLDSTPADAVSCTYRLDTASVSFSASGTASVPRGPSGAAVHVTTDCTWHARAGSSSVHLSTTGGLGNGLVTITVDPNTTGQTRQMTVVIGGQFVTVTQGGPSTQGPFGFIDTPQDGAAGLSGAIAISGWAIDDVAVDRDEIFRDPAPTELQVQIPVGTATFVEGARPDVQSAFPSLPFASRAGWGYLLLTNMLPGGGDGTYRFHVYAQDIEGQRTLLGSRTIGASNATASRPFGTIDTPASGEVVSGTIVNWGWALTPQPGVIPADGSTITVLVDDVPVGRPTYGLARSDIVSLFPNYQNTTSAVGFFVLDTTTLANGLHTLAWVVRDNMNRVQGVGSRFITVQNR